MTATAEPRQTTTPGTRADLRTGGVLLATGAITMFLGAIAWATTGTDLDAALVGGDVAGYLASASDSAVPLRLNLSLWIVGVVLIGMGGTNLSGRVAPAWRGVSRFTFIAGPASAIVFFSMWLAIVVTIAPAHAVGDEAALLGAALGQAATIADWIATALIVGLGAFALSRSDWSPRWLRTWGSIALAAGLVALVALAFLDRSPIGFAVVPIGLGFMVAAGITAIRKSV